MGASTISRNILGGTIGIIFACWVIESSYWTTQYEYKRFQCNARFNELKSIIPDDKIVTLIFPENTVLHWEKVNKELEWKDKLYDVIEIKHSSSHLVIRCIEDGEEQAIIRSFRNRIACNSGQDNDLVSFSFHHIKYILPTALLFTFVEEVKHPKPIYFEFLFGLRTIETASPPPDRRS
ncbi:MAG: hypothetical protein ABIR66_09090 [Saprospiraceae bacterium]